MIKAGLEDPKPSASRSRGARWIKPESILQPQSIGGTQSVDEPYFYDIVDDLQAGVAWI